MYKQKNTEKYNRDVVKVVETSIKAPIQLPMTYDTGSKSNYD